MANLNQVNLIGNLTRDVEFKMSSSGKEFAKTGLAINKKTSAGDQTLFVNLTFFGKSAELVKDSKKGDSLYVSGELQLKDYTTKEGDTKMDVSVIVNQFQFLTSKPKAAPKVTKKAAPTIDADDEIPF